jgi:hypothetical protein
MNSDRAKVLLQDDLFNSLVDKQRKLYIDTILNSAEDAIDVRERALIKLRAIDEFIASIESVSKDQEVDKKRWKIF